HETGPVGGPRDSGHDSEDRGEPVVGAVDGAGDPAPTALVPFLAAQDAVELLLSARDGHRRRLRRRGAHLLDGKRVRALVLADTAEQSVGLVVAGGALVAVANLVVLGSLAGGEQPIDRSELRLQACPQREAHRGGDRHAELGEAPLDARPVAGLRGGHAPEYLGAALVTLALGDQLIHRAGL